MYREGREEKTRWLSVVEVIQKKLKLTKSSELTHMIVIMLLSGTASFLLA